MDLSKLNLADRIFGGLEKLTITSMDREMSFEAMFNPESFIETFSTEYTTVSAVNAEEEKKNYVKTNPQNFSLKLIIDGTGIFLADALARAVQQKKLGSVYDRVNRFLKMAWYPNPDTKKPDLLCVEWGALTYYCHLSNVNITYALFDKDGFPLRAEMDVSFFGDAKKNSEVYATRFSSSLADVAVTPKAAGTGKKPAGTGSAKKATPGGSGGAAATSNGIVISIT